MTSKSKNVVRSYETEIEKSREEGNWKKAVELAQQLKSRSPQHESLAHFLIGEGKLEAYIEEWPPIKENIERAQRELTEARGYLTSATDEAGRKAGVALDAHLLLGKLNYACGAYDEALKHYRLAELNTLTEKELPIRSLRIVAESYAIKGLCLEGAAPPAGSRYKQAERDADMMRSFEVSSELSLLYLQRAGSGARAGPTLETALQRAPILHMRAGRLQSAIDRYREMLAAVESASTASLRLTLARQLAEVLLRGGTGQVYKPPSGVWAGGAGGTLARRNDRSDGPWKPRKYAGLNQFVPTCAAEEALLVLVLGEALAAREAVLSQSPEFSSQRQHSLHNAESVLDLLALPAARGRHLGLLTESLERAMKFSFGARHIWRQRALAAAGEARTNTYNVNGASRSRVSAVGVLRHAASLAPQDAALRLVAADLCYKQGWLEEGISWAEAALKIEEEREGPLLARSTLHSAHGYFLMSQKTLCRIEKERCEAKCEELLLRAVALDPDDHLAHCRLAAAYAARGRLHEAMDATRSCLSLYAVCPDGLRVCASVWGAGARGGARGALAAAGLARHHHPDEEWPVHAVVQLHPDLEVALSAGKELLHTLQEKERELAEESASIGVGRDARSDSQRGTMSVVAESVAGLRATSTLGSLAGVGGGNCSSPLAAAKARAWLLLAQKCLSAGRSAAATGCVSEAAALEPHSHEVYYTRGLVHLAAREWDEARVSLQSALAIHPTHVDSLVQLGTAYYELGWLRLAEAVLRQAGSLDPARADTYRRLARVLHARGEPRAAAACAAAALQALPGTPRLGLPP